MNELKPPPSLLTWPVMLPFSVGALGCAALLGLGNGAVLSINACAECDTHRAGEAEEAAATDGLDCF